MIRILVIDDHIIVHRGLREIVAEEPDMVVAGEARSGVEGLSLAQAQPWDVVVLDLSMPSRGGLEVLKELKGGHPKLPVLILSMYPEEQYAIRALQLGASGYLTKESAAEELIRAIRKVVRGGRYVSSTLAETLAGRMVAVDRLAEQPLHETLSEREFLVLRLMASGKTVADIANELALDTKTISTYRARILEKMGMKSDAELTHYAIRNKLVE